MKNVFVGFLGAFLFAVSGHSYKFICNGYLANGEERADECGVCDEDRAARWASPLIEIVVDDSKLPRSLSKSLWHQVVNNSFQAWNQVSGSSLRLVRKDDTSKREFGGNDDIHEVFWITDRQEWRRLVGSGEFGTLGATLPRYTCSEEEKSRSIFDADLVLNGMQHINWKLDCHSEDCISPQTTLVHELGHFFGLDHPCLMCSSSIMSARAGFDLTYPVFDDMQGLRALYPDNSAGGFGFPCQNHQDCLSGVCQNDGQNSYCSDKCTTDNDCKFGALCQGKNAQRLCTFVDDQAAGGRIEGESCLQKPCSEPMVCAGASDYNYFCFMPCQNNRDCKNGQSCVALEEDLSLCVKVKKLAESCDHRELCDDNLFCVFDNLSTGFCRAPCAQTGRALSGCPAKETCQRVADGVELCIPEGYPLNLDDNQDGFGHERGQNPGVDLNKNRGQTDAFKPFGCRTDPHGSNPYNLWLFLVVLMLMKKYRLLPFN